MMEKVKFVQFSRTICPKTGTHFLDAISDDGIHWTAEMSSGMEKWLCYSKQWSDDRQQPFKTT